MKREGYILVADILGFKNIVINLSDDDLLARIDEWVKLISDLAEKYHIDDYQLISDTLFVATESTKEGLEKIICFSRDLLTQGVLKSIPIRGGIVHGKFSWGQLIYGRAVVDAHILEQKQNWLGITCEHKLKDLEHFYSLDKVIIYPSPMKNSVVGAFGVISWEVPDADKLLWLLTAKGLTKDGELVSSEFIEKANNTILFRIYQDLMRTSGKSPKAFYGITPIQSIFYSLNPTKM